MPFDGSGNYAPPSAPTFPAVSGAVISSNYYNSVINDLSTALNNALTRDGQGKPSAAINWNGQNLTNINVFGATGAATFGSTVGITGALTGAAGSFTSLTVAGSAVVTSANLLAGILAVDGAASGIDADLLDGQHGAYYLPVTSYTAADVLAKLLTVDGAGSLLDADLLDGQQGAAYALLSGATFSGALVGNGTLTLNNTNEFSLGLTAATVSTQTAILSMPVALFDNSSNAAGNGIGLRFRLGDTGGVLRTAGEIASVATAKDASSVTTDMVFLPTATERMRLTSAGNLGVGTVGGDFGRTMRLGLRHDQNAATQCTIINGTTGGAATVQFSKIGGTGNSFIDWSLFDNAGAPYDAFNYGSGVLSVRWQLGGTERIRFLSTGEVGIGVTGPGEKLEVSGTTKSKNFRETTFALSGTTPAIDPGNGGIQTWTLAANSTPTDSLSDGESVTLMVADGAAAYAVTWPTMTWIGGSAPTLPTTGYAVITLWKVSTTLYGSYAGDVA